MNGIDYNEVCEGAFLVALGKLGNMKTNQVTEDCVIVLSLINLY